MADPVPDYQRIIDDITQQVDAGVLKPGDQLPSIEQMALQYRTSKTTVKTARTILKDRGIIYGRQGKAVYVATREPTTEAP